MAELRRGEDALWEIAVARATKLAQEIQEKGSVTIDLGFSPATESASKTIDPDASASFDVPFLSQATFRALIFASPLLHTFFESDLPQSFLLQPVERHTSTKDALLSVFNDVTAGPSSSSTGPGSMLGGSTPPSRPTGITRDRVKGLLGGLLGEVADAVGTRFQQQTISGPKPSFNRSRGAGGRPLSLEEGARGTSGKMGLVSPAALSSRMERTSLSASNDGSASASAAATASAAAANAAREKEQDATEALRLAQEALSQRDTNQFVIDAPGEGDGDETVERGDEEEDEEDLVDEEAGLTAGAGGVGAAGGGGAQGRVTGKEAQLAKGEYLTGAEIVLNVGEARLTPSPLPPALYRYRSPIGRSTIDYHPSSHRPLVTALYPCFRPLPLP